MENSRLIEWDEVAEVLAALLSELRCVLSDNLVPRPELIFVMEGSPEDEKILSEMIGTELPELAQLADMAFVAVLNGRYYELKNAGAKRARGDILVFADSDAVPEQGWLRELLRPFHDTDTVVANGYTYLESDNLFSRTYALFWIFPLRGGDDRFAGKRSLNANNCAFRREYFLTGGQARV